MKHAFPKLKALHAVFGIDCPYSEAERGVAAVLILDRNDATGHAYRGQDGIAQRAGISRRTAQRALDSLVARTDGPLLVNRIAQGGRTGRAGGRAPNHYAISLRVTMTQNTAKVARHGDAEPNTRLCAKSARVVRQTEGGLRVTVAQDLSSDLSSDLSTPASHRSAETFSLEIPTPKSEPTKKRPGPSKAKPEPKWPGVHPQAVAVYVEVFKRVRGADPFFGPREAKAVSKLLDAVNGDLQRFRELVENGLANWDQATILTIAADPSKAVARRAYGFRGPVQQTNVDPFEGVRVIR
ncbi:MAG TPA: hypothetical protein VHB79_38790 [Polyangiaceae bacterium]|nr:hypothetical protein [Polyangiaceae bacterium]